MADRTDILIALDDDRHSRRAPLSERIHIRTCVSIPRASVYKVSFAYINCVCVCVCVEGGGVLSGILPAGQYQSSG